MLQLGSFLTNLAAHNCHLIQKFKNQYNKFKKYAIIMNRYKLLKNIFKL